MKNRYGARERWGWRVGTRHLLIRLSGITASQPTLSLTYLLVLDGQPVPEQRLGVLVNARTRTARHFLSQDCRRVQTRQAKLKRVVVVVTGTVEAAANRPPECGGRQYRSRGGRRGPFEDGGFRDLRRLGPRVVVVLAFPSGRRKSRRRLLSRRRRRQRPSRAK